MTHLLIALDFHFDIIRITETKVTKSNELLFYPKIDGCTFEYVPTLLASEGVALFIDETFI